MLAPVAHRTVVIDGVEVFYREAGPPDAPRQHRPPTLIVWGPHDGYMPEGAARAYLRDLPDAELHLLDGGHWVLETNPDEIVALTRDFLGRVHAGVVSGRAAISVQGTRSSRGFGRHSRPTFAHGRPSTITTSAVKSFAPRISDEPTP